MSLTVKFEILAWNYYDISEWVRFANITIRLYLYHFSKNFHFAQASKRVSVFEGHVHQQSAMAAISSSVGLLHD